MVILRRLISIFSYVNLISLFYPLFCRNCNQHLSVDLVLCDDCYSLIKPVATKYYALSSTEKIAVMSVSTYVEPLRTLILRKFCADPRASMQLGTIMIRSQLLQKIDADCLIPVPLHWMRYAKRGFNQATEIAKQVSAGSNIPTIDCVRRVKKTVFQSTLSPKLRKKNVCDAFALSSISKENLELYITGKHIVIVDDLCTTGNTLIHVAKTLLPLKPAKITAIVAARGF